MKKRYLIPLLALTAVSVAAGWFLTRNPASETGQATATVLMKEDKFEPDNLSVKKGATVIFKNDDRVERWPASNLHPTHTIYPRFDPQKPIEPGQSWSFTFDNAGSWKYHDHLIPSIRGVITVTNKESDISEIRQLQSKSWSFDELKKYFTNLAEKKGAQYAFDVLKTAPLPPDTDLHLLGHVVSDILYKQQGADGIQICTRDFRNACSHSIVVGLFTDKGEAALSGIGQACQKAPGGLGAYIMCYHGLGHGILAYSGYDFLQTLNYCQKTGTVNYQFKEYPECVSGAVMEIISGGGHDHNIWLKQRTKYLKADHPFYLCSADFMPEQARGRCYDYITPYLWESTGANPDHPDEADFKKSFALCSQISESSYRRICYGGFGKEFVTLAAARDIRKVDQMDNQQLKQAVLWCSLAPDQQAVNDCLGSALSSIYWGGENDVSAAVRFCNVIADPGNQKNCFQNLIGQVSFYVKDPGYRESFCEKLPSGLFNECQQRLS